MGGVEAMDEQKIEQQQYGAVNVQVPKEEWIKPKSDKVVLYHLKKRKIKSYVLGCVVLFLTVIGFTIVVLQMRTVSLDKLSGLKYDIGKYVVGDIDFRTKMVETEFSPLNGGNKKWKYYVGIQYGENGKYILMLLDEKSYEKYETLPEINPSEVETYQSQEGESLRIEGKVMNIDTIPNYLEYWQEVVGITEDELENENGFFSEKKQLELLEKKMTLIEYIMPRDVLGEKALIVRRVAEIYLLLAAIFFWKVRFDFFDTEERIE